MGEPTSWNEDLIEERLRVYMTKLGRMPKSTELRQMDPALEGAITRNGGFRAWARRLGRVGDIRTAWSPEVIEARLLPYVERMGRMPTAPELVEFEGDNKLSVAVTRYGGYRHWAAVFDAPMKDSTTSRGQDWEDHEEEFFIGLGLNVKRQMTKAKFDLLVNGHRVDVKSAAWTSYVRKEPVPWVTKGVRVQGFVFANLRRGADCDLFDLLCLDGKAVKYRFLVPAAVARVTMLTITQRQLDGLGKYSRFMDDLSPLRDAPGCTRRRV